MNKNKVREMLSIKYPLFQGPFGGGYSTPSLVSKVSNLGGLGGYGAYQLTPERIKAVIQEIKQLTNKPFNINLWVNDADADNEISDELYSLIVANYKEYFDLLNVPIPDKPKPVAKQFEKQVEMVLSQEVPVFSFVFGIPNPTILREFKRRGIKTIGAATTLEEGLLLEETDVDLIVASGFEAGGHRPSFLLPVEESYRGTFVLVQQLAKRISKPIIAAGGITNGSAASAALTLGASGVQVGTAFLACEESGITEDYRNVLFSQRANNTILTKDFTGRIGRGIPGILTEQVKLDRTLPFPIHSQFIAPLRKAALEQGKLDLIPFWAGQNVSEIEFRKAAMVFNDIVKGLI
ncbi:nitronate monooxygenase [Flavobacterium sp. CYK-4]|uniref:NAD(P)H-dependent flavin oxidoreductase n=1 Tax=Flavobacterium lotistagni TaxID=2709660 RepID=UPI00140A91BB|nr:nitronate monooxygenase [Flavobacterium lotistagni]NHM07595.1 nitronate monooxygenase [Flavobacterium lotistagni]